MQRRHQHLNVPSEIVRTIVAISETGSLSKAAERLGLGQSAVSGQIKRIQNLLGGELFNKTSNGAVPTPFGKLVLDQARRMLDANDQMLRLGGSVEVPRPLRFGISASMVKQFLRSETAETLAGIVIRTDNSLGITKGLMDGYTDIGCICENLGASPDISDMIVNEREETFVWVRSKDFVLSPGAPIPLLTGPGDDIMIRTLTKQGITYRIVFKGSDYCAKMAALEKGIGLAVLPGSMIPSGRGQGVSSAGVSASQSATLCASGIRNSSKGKVNKAIIGLLF
jgi:DNA-binding transcriptional LysR family regulator